MSVAPPRKFNNPLAKALRVGLALQVAMVLVGHFVPSLAAAGLFPVAGSAIALLTGILAAWTIPHLPAGVVGATGALAAGVSGALGSLVSAALGDVPLGNIGIAAGSTLLMGLVGSLVTRAFRRRH